METSLNTITVNKVKLLNTLRDNKNKHVKTVQETQEGYRESVIKILSSRLKEIKNGGKINLHFNLPTPEDHTADYTIAVGMLEWCLEDVIQLTKENYENFVLDQWSWSTNFSNVTGLYCKK